MEEIQSNQVDFAVALADKAELVNSTLAELLQKRSDIGNELRTAIEYTLQAPGKRIQSALVLWCCELVSGSLNRDA